MGNIEKYRLYRSLYDIINPTISRKNISDYQIIIDRDILPIEVYYPNKSIKLNHIIIYISSSNKFSDLYQQLAINTNNLVIVFSYNKEKEVLYSSIKYIYDNIDKVSLDTKSITMVTDNDSSIFLDYVIDKSTKTKDFIIDKSILLYPDSSLNEITINNSLIVVNKDINSNIDCNVKKYNMCLDDFFSGKSTDSNKHIYNIINDYINGG